MQPKDRIIVALDVPNLDQAEALVSSLAPFVSCFKIGLELITNVGGPQAVDYIHRLGGQVFYDGKFCDIPNTVAAASKAVAKKKVKMFNLHASCGAEAIEKAVANRDESAVLGVTVLTSMDEAECFSIFGNKPGPKVLQFARMLLHGDAQGIVCSPEELDLLGQYPEFDGMQKIIPGTRSLWAAANDQKRIMTPAEAVKAKATALVIGRPITDPPKEIGGPVDAVKRILDEISAAS